ncbi:hypothetical protein OOZ63_06385 [Paucibacter sp. PLA-PC-4]|uniref:hypothetical protein n=1 Tax=Paucibacter sp. PLA-PC-4 TaxID=2993655 RepID=UPI0022487A2B|nr:hypothetical protein [Paucibacter sp. PLA-PC-4]MCX2861464.1 hypothetical protein [Paucibacter sp. PLA-PC-4]
MPASNNSPRSGINRANLRNAPPRAARKPVAEAVAPAVLPRPVAVAPTSAFGEFLQIVGAAALLLGGLALLLMGVQMMSDSVTVGKHLAEAKAQRGVLVCQDGRMVRGDGSLRDMILADAYFSCTDWRTLQSIELEEKSK